MVLWKYTKLLYGINHKWLSPLHKNLANYFFRVSRMYSNLDTLRNKILPSSYNLSIGQFSPQTSQCLFIAPSAHIRGNVEMLPYSIVSYSASIECISNSQNDKIQIGKNSVIQELASIKALPNESVIIGDKTIISPNCRVRNSHIGDNVFIGPGCQLVNAHIKDGAYLAAGTVVRDGVVEANQVVCKSPFEVLRTISLDEKEYVEEMVNEHKRMGIILSKQHAKTAGELFQERYEHDEIAYNVDDNQSSLQMKKAMESMNIGTGQDDAYFNTYREWVLEERQERRVTAYKQEEYEGIDFDQRPKEMFGAFMPNLKQHIKMEELSEKLASENNVPDFDRLTKTTNYREKIEAINKEANKF
jgi:carbonic anhydrase/acetyltransferase-like protein (isoleucine patch superfamily)